MDELNIEDKELGISIRFVREWKPDTDFTMFDRAYVLACLDDREDVMFLKKLLDAMAFIKSQIH